MKPIAMYLQDPLTPELHGNWELEESSDFLEGTGTSRFCVRDEALDGSFSPRGLDWAKSDISFEYFQKKNRLNTIPFNQANVFAVAGHTLEFIEAELGYRIPWRSGGPLILRPHAFRGLNAYYDSNEGALNFGAVPQPWDGGVLSTCQSHDVVAHELSHAVLDALRPLYGASTDLDTPALGESLCDLIAMFSTLEHLEVVERLYSETGGDLSKPNLVSQLGPFVGHGGRWKPVPLIRSALTGPSYDLSSPPECHARASVWTAAIYELLSRLVKQHAPALGFTRAIVEASRWVAGLVLRTLHYTPPTHLTMPMLARLMYEADALVYRDDNAFREVARGVFEERSLWKPKLSFAAPAIGADIASAANERPGSLARAVMAHAEALRIPRGAGVRILAPRLVTATRKVDSVKDANGTAAVKEIVEHYLSYAYETMIPGWVSGRSGTSVLRGGGTLAFDARWKPLLLATYPEATE